MTRQSSGRAAGCRPGPTPQGPNSGGPKTQHPPARTENPRRETGRLAALDGLRGLAALLVVVYHFSARWAAPRHPETLYPHGNLPEALPILWAFADIGILLFFLISGFVIIMTLERCTGLLDFALRRAARLWPAMLVCASLSTLVIALSGIPAYYDMARWAVTPMEYLLSIFFIPPGLVAERLGLAPAHWVEGAYWTLWVEIRFYALIALTLLLAGRRHFLAGWAGVQAASLALLALPLVDADLRFALFWPDLMLQPGHLGWFGLGICGYMVWCGRAGPLTWLIAALAMTQIWLRPALMPVAPELVAAMVSEGRDGAAAYPVILGVFALFLARSRVMRLLTWRPLLAVGLASYPLYLFHELAGMAVFKAVAEAGWAPWLGPALAMPLVIAAALAIHHLAEEPGKRLILRLGLPLGARAEARLRLLRFGPTR